MKIVLVVVAAGLLVSGCATKRYGRAIPLSSGERASLSCEGISVELSKVEALEDAIKTGSKTDVRSAMGFLMDFGIGNSMEKGDAERSAALRRGELKSLAAEKGCPVR